MTKKGDENIKRGILKEHFPLNGIESSFHISPESVIQLALSTYRKSNFTDKEIAEYISGCLSAIMWKNKFDITYRDIRETDERFRMLWFKKSKQ